MRTPWCYRVPPPRAARLRGRDRRWDSSGSRRRHRRACRARTPSRAPRFPRCRGRRTTRSRGDPIDHPRCSIGGRDRVRGRSCAPSGPPLALPLSGLVGHRFRERDSRSTTTLSLPFSLAFDLLSPSFLSSLLLCARSCFIERSEYACEHKHRVVISALFSMRYILPSFRAVQFLRAHVSSRGDFQPRCSLVVNFTTYPRSPSAGKTWKLMYISPRVTSDSSYSCTFLLRASCRID